MLNKKVRKLWRKVFVTSVAAILIATTSIGYSVVSFADAEIDGGILFEEFEEEEPEELQEPKSETEVDEENDEEVKEPVEEAEEPAEEVEEAEEPAEEGKESAKEGEELAKEAEEVAETVDTEETNELEVEPIDGLAADSSAANPTRLMNGRALGATPSDSSSEISYELSTSSIYLGEVEQDSYDAYALQNTKYFTLKNTGTPVIVKYTYSDIFYINHGGHNEFSLDSGEEVSIDISPMTGLKAGFYTETFEIQLESKKTRKDQVTFTVQASINVTEHTEDFTLTPSTVVFEDKVEGYTNGGSQTITIKNTGTAELNFEAVDSEHFMSNRAHNTVKPGEEKQFYVSPKSGLPVGTYNETITVMARDINHGDRKVSKDINLSFTVKEKTVVVETVDLSITPSDLVFTTSSEGYSWGELIKHVTLKNPCDFPIDYDVILPTDSNFELREGRRAYSLLVGGETNIGFSPKDGLTPGNYSETVTVNYNNSFKTDIAGSKTFTMSFTVTEKAVVEEKVASFTVTPDNFVFEEKIVGYDSSTKIITVKNTGTATLRYGVWDSDSFTVSGLTGKTAAPGEELQATVAPRADLPVGSYNETITIEAFDTVNTDKKVSKDINLSFKVIEKAEENPVNITVTPSNVVFEEEEVGYGYNLKTITIKNTGTVTVNYGAWDSDSFMINGLTGKSAEPDEEIQVTVQPKLGLEAGKYNETITIDATDAFHSVNKVTKDINLSFTVKEKAVETIDLSITPSDLVFTTSNEGYSKSDLLKYVTLKNPCDFSVYYSVILPTDSRFELMEGRLSDWIAADGSLEIGFAPISGLAPGKYSETVTVNYHKSGYSIIAGSQTFKMYFTVTKDGEEPERTEVTEVTATSNITEIFKDGEAVIEPKFMVDGEEGAYFLNGEGVFSRWEKKDGDSWVSVDGADELFTPGEWRVKAPVWLDSATSFLAQDAEVTVDGELWTTEAGEITDDYSFIWVTSPVFTIEDEKPERTAITEVTATSNIASITINGEDIKEPKFDITVGTEAHFTYDEKTMWLKKIDKDEWEEVTDGTFTPGTWQYKAKLIIDGEQAEQYYLGKFLTVTIDGEVWKGIGGYLGEDSSYVELISPDITISEDATMTEYEVEGDGQVFTKGDTNDITIRAMGDLDKLTSIKIDGKEIWIEGSVTDSALFSVVSGSTVLTLNNAYLNDTETGEHEVAFEYTDGYANAKFTVKDASSSGGSNDDPSQGGSNDDPSQGGSNDNPSTGGSNDNPSTGGSNDNPSTGGSNSGNQGGSSSSQPSQGSQSSSNNDAASSESTPAATPAQTAANANAAVLGETRDRAPEATAVTPAGTTATDNAAVLGETRSASTDDTSNAPLRMMIIMISVLGIAGIALAGKTKIKK